MESKFWTERACTLTVSTLLGEIATRAHIIGEAQVAKGTAAPEAWSVQPETDADTADGMLLRRTLTNAWRRMAGALHEHVLGSTATAEVLTVRFRVPVRYSDAAKASLPRLLREYEVSTALAEWFGHCGWDDGGSHAEDAAATLTEIERTLSMRLRP